MAEESGAPGASAPGAPTGSPVPAPAGGEAGASAAATGGGTSLVRDQGNASLLDWRATLPEAIRTHTVLQQFPTTEAAAKTLVAQAEMIGRGLYLPREDADDAAKAEALDKVYARLGRPKDAASYAITPPALPEGMAWDPEMERQFREEAWAAGLSQQQVERLLAFEGRRAAQLGNLQAAAEARSYEEGQQALAREFGASAPRLLARARGFFEHFGRGAFGGEAGVKAWQAIADSGLANNPHVIAAFAQAFDRLGEGEFFDSEYYQAGASTLDTLRSRFDALTAKRYSPTGATPQEEAEWGRLAEQLDRARQQGGGRTPGRAA